MSGRQTPYKTWGGFIQITEIVQLAAVIKIIHFA